MTERLQHNPDEFVLENVNMVHYEVMDWGDEDNNNRGSVWMGIYTKDNKIYHLNISGENLKVYYSNETPEDT